MPSTASRPVDCGPGGRCLAVKVVAERFEADFVDEARHGQLANLLRLNLTRLHDRHDALRADGVAGCIVGHGDRRVDEVAVIRDETALAVELERSVTGIGDRVVRLLDLEVAFAVDREVIGALGWRQIALAHDAGRRDRLHTRSDKDTRRNLRILVGGERTGAALLIVEQVLKLHRLALEAAGAQVGDVIRDDLNGEFLCRHAGGCGVESAHG